MKIGRTKDGKPDFNAIAREVASGVFPVMLGNVLEAALLEAWRVGVEDGRKLADAARAARDTEPA